LVRRLCQSCKYQELAPPQLEKIIAEEIGKLSPEVQKKLDIKKPYRIWRAKGCVKCGRKGFRGRIAVFEIFVMTSQLRQMLLDDPQNWRLEEEADRQGMITLRQDGIIKVLQGIVTMEELMRVIEIGVAD